MALIRSGPNAVAVCPRCGSPEALSLTPAVRDWFCCGACGHMWPKQDPVDEAPDIDKDVAG
jgi:hypothetical protein